MDHAELHDDNPTIISTQQTDDEIFYRTIPKSTSSLRSNKLVTVATPDIRQAQENRFVQSQVVGNQRRQQITKRPRTTTTTPRPPPPPPVHHTAAEQQQANFVPSEVLN